MKLQKRAMNTWHVGCVTWSVDVAIRTHLGATPKHEYAGCADRALMGKTNASDSTSNANGRCAEVFQAAVVLPCTGPAQILHNCRL